MGEKMANNHIGYVVRVARDAVYIAVNDNVLKDVAIRGKFLEIQTRSGRKLVGIVTYFNLYDELYHASRGRIEMIEEYEKLIRSRNEIIVALLGTLIDENGKRYVERKIETYPTPGDKVYILSKEVLKEIFGNGDIRIGCLTTEKDVSVCLNLNELATKHLAILAMTGSGKSNALGVLVARIMKEFPNSRIVIIDTHSEYIDFARKDSPLSDKAIVFCPLEKFKKVYEERGIRVKSIEIPYWLLTIEEWFSLLGLDPRATRQRRIFRMALRDIKRRKFKDAKLNDPIYFNIEELCKRLSSSAGRDVSATEVLTKLEDALESEEYNFVLYPEKTKKVREEKGDVEAFLSVIKPLLFEPGLKIIALGGLSAEVQIAVVSMILRSLFRIAVESKLLGRPIPTMVAVEEAHIYAPKDYSVPSKPILERIAKEGRKFGIGLIVISQRPRELSETVLAQCGTLIALRTVNPSDQRHIQNSLEDITSALALSLPGLGTGEAVVSGRAISIPCIVKIDYFDEVMEREYNKRLSLSGKDIDFRELWSKPLEEEVIHKIIREIIPEFPSGSETTNEAKSQKITQFFG